jgi:hypothetical protein
MILNLSVILSFTWFAYFIVFLITLYKMSQFFKELEAKKILADTDTVKELHNLYLTSFILQIVALVITLLVLVAFSFYVGKMEKSMAMMTKMSKA